MKSAPATAAKGRKKRNGARPLNDKAEQLAGRLAALAREHQAALEQQAATAEILRALSRSSSDPQPVFDAIVKKAHHLCAAAFSILYRYDGERLTVLADSQPAEASRVLRRLYPQAPRADHIIGKTVLEGRPMHTAEIALDKRFPANRNAHNKLVRFKAALAVPLRRDGRTIGAIAAGRPDARPFSTAEIRLLQTFADQAVIAIENVRLFNETREALEHQKASADVLKIVASSVESTDPVFEAITSAGMRLIPGVRVALTLVRDGQLHYVSHSGVTDARRTELAKLFPLPLDRTTVVGTAVLDRRVLQVPDIQATGKRYQGSLSTSRIAGWRAALSVPLLSKDEIIGALTVTRREPGPFTPRQIDLARNFADQAAIAIRNSAFFREINERNDELREALEQQKAITEVLRVISDSPGDVKPVLQAVAERAARICEADDARIFVADGEVLRLAAGLGNLAIAPDASVPIAGSIMGRVMRDGTPLQVDVARDGDAFPFAAKMYREHGHRIVFATPLLREGRGLGTIIMRRTEGRLFTEKQMRLLRTFADQAAIAIENARLFNETKEALERQTATAEILRVISSSPSDLRPVFTSIARNFISLCGAEFGTVYTFEGGLVHHASGSGFTPERELAHAARYPVRVDDPSVISARTIFTRSVVHVDDVLSDPHYDPARAKALGVRRLVGVPLLRDGAPLGAIVAGWAKPGATPKQHEELLKTFADQAVIAIENVRLFNETKEALERQTATSEVLRVISESQTDTQPVFETIVRSAVRLCAGSFGSLLRIDGDTIRLAAFYNPSPEAYELAATRFPAPLSEHSLVALCARTGTVMHSPDTENDPRAQRGAVPRALGVRAQLTVPLLKDGKVVAALNVARTKTGPFSDAQIEMLKTFADQAVIAIENVRLFNETKEALQRQTATAEILRVIAGSPSDVQPVLQAIADSALRLVGGMFATIARIEGEMAHLWALTATTESSAAVAREYWQRKVDPSTPFGQAVQKGVPEQVLDVETDPRVTDEARVMARARGWRSVLVVPLVRDGEVVGTINILRAEPGRFAEHEVELLKTFADQAVIAIENVRLFNETRQSLERQTATAEILNVISRSPTDTQPVFEVIAASARRLLGGSSAAVTRIDGDALHIVAMTATTPAGEQALRDVYPVPLSAENTTARAVRAKAPVWRVDMDTDPDVSERLREMARTRGYRSVLSMPMLRGDDAIGALSVARAEAGSFTDHQISVLKTFADQAVIAIENVRLFNETKEALERQTASSDVLAAISGAQTDVRPVFDAIARNAQRLCGAVVCNVLRYDGDLLHIEATHGFSPEQEKKLWDKYPVRAGDASVLSGRVVVSRRIEHIEDVEADPAYDHAHAKDVAGWRRMLGVPMLRDDVALGVIVVAWRDPGKTPENQIELLRTFAAQAAIAIENVRLFNETKEALDHQTATADILKVISSSTSDTQPVFEAIVQSAARLFAPRNAFIVMREGNQLVRKATAGARVQTTTEELNKSFPLQLDPRSNFSSQAVIERRLVEVLDTEHLDAGMPVVGSARAAGYRSVTIVPLMREEEAIGTISLTHPESGQRLSEKQLALLRTFADQAVIAIENVRLFNETKDALEQQTASAQVLGSISSSIADTQPVFDKIVESCARLFEGHHVGIALLSEDGLAHLAAYSGAQREEFERTWPVPVSNESAMGRAILSQQVVHWADVMSGQDVPPYLRRSAEKNRAKSVIVAPMLWEGRGIGGIWVGREFAAPFTEKVIRQLTTFADQAVIAIQNARMFQEIQDRNTELRQSLEFQGATSEILASISSSIADPQPVFDAINRNLLRLVGARFGAVMLVRDNQIHVPAVKDAKGDPAFDRILERYPIPLDDRTAAGQAILSGKVVHLTPVIGNPAAGETAQANARAFGYNSIISAPMVRDGSVVGAVTASRLEARAFDDKEIALIKAFADQAVIAIENARLFNETKEALEQQTATAEILKVISSSPTDEQPVFDAIVKSAAQLFAPCTAVIVMREGDSLFPKARGGPTRHTDPAALANIWPLAFDPERSVAARCIAERRIIEIPDTEAAGLPHIVAPLARAAGYRSITVVPLIKDGEGIGLIGLNRPEPGFKLTEKQLSLVRTFADQAVIAIENVRLFKELQARTEALTKSVGQLTALGDVGRAIGSTLDLDTVLKTIVSRALQLTGLSSGSIYEYDEQAEEFRLRAGEGMSDETVATLRSQPIRKGEGTVGATAVRREPVQVADIHAERYDTRLREILVRAGRRAVLAVPLLREERIIGALAVQKDAAGAFAPEVVELLKTFATQSAMAIQNARLYREIEEKGKQLETASQHKSQFLASMSHELRTPLNAILGFNEMILDEVYGEVPVDMKDPLQNIQTSGKHLLRLINNVLDLAKIEAGRMELALADYSVQDTVGAVHSTLKPLAAEKGLEFLAVVPADLPLAHGDGGRISQCLMNLAGNALKFTKSGRVEIAVAQENGLLRYSVSDTGIGIPAEKIASLFTEFKQTDATIASEYGGTGLGLSITKKFIEMHGGRIWVESEPGRGSSFRFEVPARVAQ